MKGESMFGPGLLVIAGIGLIVFGPKKLPDLTKTLGQAMKEYKKISDEVKGSFASEVAEIRGVRNNISRMDLLTHLAEKVSASVPSQEVEREIGPGKNFGTSPAGALNAVENDEKSEEGKKIN